MRAFWFLAVAIVAGCSSAGEKDSGATPTPSDDVADADTDTDTDTDTTDGSDTPSGDSGT